MTRASESDTVTIWYHQMTDPSRLRPAREPELAHRIEVVEPAFPAFNQFLYQTVGAPWRWHDRLPWTIEQWAAWADRPEHETSVLYVGGAPAGYVEIEQQAAGDVEIAYFGLLERWIGKGLGGHLLTYATRRAWALEPTRVWLHTCSLDAPGARANYAARGFEIYREETQKP